MSEAYWMGVYWGSRQETAEVCAGRAATFFRLLSECHPDYARWYEQASSPQRALRLSFEPTPERFMRFFELEKYQILDDGFSFSAWTGHEQQERGGMVMFHCGSDAEVAPNSVRLHFPKEALGSERMLTASLLSRVMKAMVMAWEPEWAIATSDDLWKQFSNGGRLGTFVGWVTYFSNQRGGLPELPTSVRVEPVDDKGTLILLTPDRLTASRPEHVLLVQRIHSLLDARGLLRGIIEDRAS